MESFSIIHSLAAKQHGFSVKIGNCSDNNNINTVCSIAPNATAVVESTGPRDLSRVNPKAACSNLYVFGQATTKTRTITSSSELGCGVKQVLPNHQKALPQLAEKP